MTTSRNFKITEARKYKTIIAAMSASLALIYLDQTGVALTLNQIQHELAISNSSINWIVNAYLLALGCSYYWESFFPWPLVFELSDNGYVVTLSPSLEDKNYS